MHLGLRIALIVVALAALAIAGTTTLLGSGDDVSFGTAGDAGFPPRSLGPPAEVWAVGDGADGSERSRALASRIEAADPDRFLYLGDVYDDGSASDFVEGYAPVYGRFDSIAAPTPGNHEWGDRETGYFPYWEAATGAPSIPPWYAFKIAGWQVLSLNSEAAHGAGSAQLDWLRERLRAAPSHGTCRLAFWHQPRYSAGDHGDIESMEPFWDRLEGRARIVLSGHDHDMQRLRPHRGIVQFVSGAGGYSLRSIDESDPRLRFAKDGVTGALRLRLRRESARYAFVEANGRVLDAGELGCRRD